jgi:hypothetical protein
LPINHTVNDVVEELRQMRCRRGRIIMGYPCDDVAGQVLRVSLSDYDDPDTRARLLAIAPASRFRASRWMSSSPLARRRSAVIPGQSRNSWSRDPKLSWLAGNNRELRDSPRDGIDWPSTLICCWFSASRRVLTGRTILSGKGPAQ